MAIRIVCCLDFSINAASWVLEWGSIGAFQCPRVLWGSDDDFGVIGVISVVSESRMSIGSSGVSVITLGEPLG